MLCIVSITMKYLSVWSLAMISLRATGITYNPSKNVVNKDNSITYDFTRIEMNHLYNFYITPSFKIKGDHWNICTVVALRRYVYENIYNPADFTDEKKRRARQFHAQLFTLVVSALWHGLYPGYYLTFTHWALGVQITH